jgi:hypothetical protein
VFLEMARALVASAFARPFTSRPVVEPVGFLRRDVASGELAADGPGLAMSEVGWIALAGDHRAVRPGGLIAAGVCH